MENKEIPEPSVSTVAPMACKSRDDTRGMRRENDSMDDFEHLEHEISPNAESRLEHVESSTDITSARLIDAPRPEEKMSAGAMDVGGGGKPESKLERNILDTSIPADERMLQPVPVTPPPSAVHESGERRYPGERVLDEVVVGEDPAERGDNLDRGRMNAKAASLAFMEIERGESCSLSSSVPVNARASLEHRTGASLEHPPGATVEHRTGAILEHRPGATLEHRPGDDDEGKVDRERIDDLPSDSGIEDTSSIVKDTPISRKSHDFVSNIASSVLPMPEKSPEYDFLAGEISPNLETRKKPAETRNLIDDETWNVVEKPKIAVSSFANGEIESTRRTPPVEEAPKKPLPPLPKNEIEEEDDDDRSRARTNLSSREFHANDDIYEMSNDYVSNAGKTSGQQQQQQQQQQSGAETGDSEFESAPEQSPAKTAGKTSTETIGAAYRGRKADENDDIAPKEIFTDMGLDAWFNPERLNPKVAALIYWRQPEKTGIVFGAILGVLLSLAYFSLISVFAYLSLLTLCCTVGFRVYKTFVQAVQKTSDGHPFKDILEVDLTLPAEKVHEVADVAVAHANATVAELRRLFLVEDFIDSFKFGVGLWCLTYLGSWFNGMTLIIIGVVALFTLPKVYETNMAQIDQNVALVRGKINELTAKVKAAIPLGKKSEPTKEE